MQNREPSPVENTSLTPLSARLPLFHWPVTVPAGEVSKVSDTGRGALGVNEKTQVVGGFPPDTVRVNGPAISPEYVVRVGPLGVADPFKAINAPAIPAPTPP